jgi:hypothetical protein
METESVTFYFNPASLHAIQSRLFSSMSQLLTRCTMLAILLVPCICMFLQPVKTHCCSAWPAPAISVVVRRPVPLSRARRPLWLPWRSGLLPRQLSDTKRGVKGKVLCHLLLCLPPTCCPFRAVQPSRVPSNSSPPRHSRHSKHLRPYRASRHRRCSWRCNCPYNRWSVSFAFSRSLCGARAAGAENEEAVRSNSPSLFSVLSPFCCCVACVVHSH